MLDTLELVESSGDVGLARRLLDEAQLADEGQRQLSTRFRTFMDSHDDCLVRSCRPGHLTASACVVDPNRNKTLLLLHKKLGRWLQPGGHADGDGNLAHVAWREAFEETGIDGLKILLPSVDLDIHPIPAHGSDPEHLHYDVRFIVLSPPNAAVRANDESIETGWFGPEDPLIVGNADVERVINRSFAVLRALGSWF